ncbi:MAG: ComF family protein [Dehalococcoidia bacterium]
MPARPPVRPLLTALADALFPQQCLACGRFGAALHPPCVAAFPPAEPPRCLRCWTPGAAAICHRCAEAPPAFEALRARFRFEGDVRRALLEAKFRGKTALLPPLASSAFEAVPPDWRVDAVVPIPLHRRRQRQRGYNQAAVLAQTVARLIDAPLAPDLLRRPRHTPPQAGLPAAERVTNLRDAFEARPLNSEVLLIDDVTTTGATFEAAARTLLNAGANRVFALAIARED